jgi:hypothetical protein
MQSVVSSRGSAVAGGSLDAELAAYNRAFSELELPWCWDADTFRRLLEEAGDHDCVSTYIERSHAHLLRVYDKSFLRDLVLGARDRCRREI